MGERRVLRLCVSIVWDGGDRRANQSQNRTRYYCRSNFEFDLDWILLVRWTLGTVRLLLVEDEADLGAAIKQVLTHQAYVVDWFLDGSQAWNYLQANWTEYTLAIVDWMLPGL